MTNKLIFKNEELAKIWADNPYYKKDGDILVVQHYEDKMFYYFEKIEGTYNFIMSSISKPVEG